MRAPSWLPAVYVFQQVAAPTQETVVGKLPTVRVNLAKTLHMCISD